MNRIFLLVITLISFNLLSDVISLECKRFDSKGKEIPLQYAGIFIVIDTDIKKVSYKVKSQGEIQSEDTFDLIIKPTKYIFQTASVDRVTLTFQIANIEDTRAPCEVVESKIKI